MPARVPAEPGRAREVGTPADFWNRVWTGFEPFSVDPDVLTPCFNSSDKSFLDAIGDVRGKSVLDIGCGNGIFSVYAARNGARVVAIDNSSIAVENTTKLAGFNGVAACVDARKTDAFDLLQLDKKFDVVIGRFILHHLEPFDRFAGILHQVMAPRGVGIFLENNAANPLLMFSRRHFVGKFGIPKYGDSQESPFEPMEKEVLKQYFKEVSTDYPEFLFFDLGCSYLFKDDKGVRAVMMGLDAWVYRHCPWFHQYSYRQIVRLVKS